MRVGRLVGPVAVAVVLVVAGPAAALGQQIISPDSLRPPLVLSASPEAQFLTAVRLQVARFAQALQRADTLQLQAVLGDVEVPPNEVAVARARGCRSLGWALAQLRLRRARAGAPGGLPLDRLVVRTQAIVLDGTGPGATVSLRLQDVMSRSRQFADLRLDFERVGDAIVLARGPGLHAALCGFALAP